MAVARLDVLEAVELVGRRAQRLGQQLPVVDAQRQLAAAALKAMPSTPIRSPRSSEAGGRTTRRRGRRAGVELDLPGAVDQVEERRRPARGARPAGRPGGTSRRAPRRPRGRVVRGADVGDRHDAREGVRERVDALFAQALELRAALGEQLGQRFVLGRGGRLLVVRGGRHPRPGLLEPDVDLGDLEPALLAVRQGDVDDLVALAADQRLADRRLVGQLALGRVGLGRADDRELALCRSSRP